MKGPERRRKEKISTSEKEKEYVCLVTEFVEDNINEVVGGWIYEEETDSFLNLELLRQEVTKKRFVNFDSFAKQLNFLNEYVSKKSSK